ncbi:MAG: cyclic nucleotide-binding domain-containing protein [Pseudomonadota bacterium]
MERLLDMAGPVADGVPPGLVTVLLTAAALFAPLAVVNLRLRGLARRWRWVFHLQAAASVAAVLALQAGLREVLPADEAGRRIADQTGQVLMWLVGALLVQQGLRLFFWEGSFRRRHGVPPGLLVTMSAALIYLLAAYAVMTFVFGQPMTGLLVSSSILVGVLGLAMQSSLADVISGVAISIERPFRMGDWIELDDGTKGEVVDINWRATHIRSWHDSLYIVPNGRIANARVHNLSEPTGRFSTWFSVHAPADIPPETVKRALLHAAVDCPAVLDDPAPAVRIVEAGATWTYRLIVRFASYPTHYTGKDALLARIWAEMAKAGIKAASEASEVVLRRAEASEPRADSAAELLAQVSLFESLDAAAWGELVDRLRVREIPAGEAVVRQGEEGTSMFVISTGLVRVEIDMEGGPREVAKLSSGACFGEMSLLAQEPRTATVIAHTDCRLLEIGADAMRAVFEQDPGLMEEIARIVSERRLANQALNEAGGGEDMARRLSQLTASLTRRMRRVFGVRDGERAG